ncbi:MAG: TIM-barrel domain-containing protein [Bacteroidota bacterium]
MKLFLKNLKPLIIAIIAVVFLANASAQVQEKTETEKKTIVGAQLINPHTVEVIYSNNERMIFDFYGENIFRLYQNNIEGIIKEPEASPEAEILVKNPRKQVSELKCINTDNKIEIVSKKISIQIDKQSLLIKLINLEDNSIVFETVNPVSFEKDKTTLKLKENTNEYFFGGGVQNGRFSHKGKAISIVNQNSWTDGGVASPAPFFWSTKGYAMMWHTFKKGKYDFGSKEKGIVKLYHNTYYLDVFFMIGDNTISLLNNYYQLTGNPVLIPKFGFYEGHLNAYNRDFWKENEKGVLFEDGKKYIESQKDNGGIKESLNGEKNNYQFSARAVIDRYKKYDMPFGWLLPNDGYGAGYGQTESLDGNIQNLKNLGDYARSHGVEIGLWTQSDLHPKPGISALLQRDIIKEIRDAGVRVLKTDVAWVGAGYSFGLNGISDVAGLMTYYGENSRPFIISLDGWAGTQRYAAIWSGDQTGGKWEYIRFHIPTYIGSGLSGIPNITSDMDGIFGGKNPVINTRDFQWKTFTPMQLNMDGWGENEKYPHALGEPTTSINRFYLKLKSALMPYAYSIAKESIDGLPIIRALFLEYPNAFTYGTGTEYEFLYGPNFLVAPIYKSTNADKAGNDVRNGIYLPKGEWIDYFSGEKYEGDRIINNFDAPIWKLPVFVKNGAIIPMTNPNNNVSEIDQHARIYEIYPYRKSSFIEYDDDGITEAYRLGQAVTTLIESETDNNSVTIHIHASQGNFKGFIAEKTSEFRINVSEKPKKIKAQIGKNKIKITEVHSLSEFKKKENVFYYNEQPELNTFASKDIKLPIQKNPQVLVKLASTDISKNDIILNIEGFRFEISNKNQKFQGSLTAITNAQVSDENKTAYTLKPSWNKVQNADYYEIEFNNMLYSTIKDTALLFEGLKAVTKYEFKVRAVNKNGHSSWNEISATTKLSPLEFAIRNIAAATSVKNQGGQEVENLFDFDEKNMWHTSWSIKAVPYDIIIDLKKIYTVDKLHYLPRSGGGNGIILKGKIYHSSNKENWTEEASFEWKRNAETKIYSFNKQAKTRYIKISVTEGVGNFGSGRELYVFSVPGTKSYLQGDINNDNIIDKNDFTSYINYTGLRKGDSDFEGYISNGDINDNQMIDAYDISVVATQLEDGVKNIANDNISGNLQISTAKKTYNKGETIEVKIKGHDFKAVNAMSFALPYNSDDYEFIGIKAINMKEMENLSMDRLHTNGEKVLYPTFVNIGNKETLEGDLGLFTIQLKAKNKVKFNLEIIKGLLVNKSLKTIKF